MCALIARIVHSDEAALRELYDTTVARVYGLALRITGRRTRPRKSPRMCSYRSGDVTRYDAERARCSPGCSRICRSRAIDFLRRRDRTEPLPDDDALADER